MTLRLRTAGTAVPAAVFTRRGSSGCRQRGERGGFTKVEATLLAEGRGASVIQQRADFQEVMVRRFKQVVEEETGRKVAALMSGSHQQPDLICETFILAPTDLLETDTADQPRHVVEG